MLPAPSAAPDAARQRAAHRRVRALRGDHGWSRSRASARDEEHFRAESPECARRLVVPLTSGGRTLGALTLATGRSGRRFDAHDLELAEELARRVRHSPSTTRGCSRERAVHRRARSSRACCPPSCRRSPASRPPRASGRPARATRSAATSTTSSRPATAAGRVVIGDVCGKGPDAAAVTALARYTLRAAAMRERLPEPQPAPPQRGPAAPARRPPLLHRRLRVPRVRATARAGRLSPAAATRCRCCCAPTARVERSGRRARCSGVRARPDLRGPLARARAAATRSSSTPTASPRRGRRDGQSWTRSALAAGRGSCAGRAPTRSPPRIEAAIDAPGGNPRDDIAVLVLRVAA